MRGGGDALLVEFESVEFAGVHAVGFGLVHVERVGCGDVVRMLVECVGDGVEQLLFGFAVCDCAGRAASPMAHTASNSAAFMAVPWFCGIVIVS